MSKTSNPSITRISASAGAGKTHTITELFLNFLEQADPSRLGGGCLLDASKHGYSLGEILAATFTNKAAAEMKTRIVSTLKQRALYADEPVKTRANRWLATILRDYSSLNIRTIDSLLNSLVRLSSLSLGISPDFTPCFKSEEYFTPFYDALMQDLKHYLQNTNALQHTQAYEAAPHAPVFYTSTGEVLASALFKACNDLVKYQNAKGFTDKGALHDKLLTLVNRLILGHNVPDMNASLLEYLLVNLHKQYVQSASTLLLFMEKEQLAVNQTFLKFLHSISTTNAFEKPKDSAFLAKETLDECLNKQSRGMASAWAYQTFEDMQVKYGGLSTNRPILLSAIGLAPLVSLAREIHQRMQASGQNLVPNICMPLLACLALQGEQGVSEAMCRLGTKLRHILLDEFQDTSREQWQSLQPLVAESLSTGGSFTYVGDVKQAIYSWRGGDAKLFHDITNDKELVAIAPQPKNITLAENWRSSQEIINFNNTFFIPLQNTQTTKLVAEQMLPKHTPDEYLQQASTEIAKVFTDIAQNYPEQKKSMLPKVLEQPTNATAHNEKAVNLYHLQGSNIAALEEMLEKRLHLLCTKRLFPHYAFGQVAFLVRNNAQATKLTEWLTAWGYPVVTENSLLLSSHPLIARLVAFLRFLDYPFDDNAFWEFVTSVECFAPLSALTPQELESWLAKQRLAGQRKALYLLFQKDFPTLWQKWFAPFVNQAGLMSAYDTIFECIKHFKLLENDDNAAFLRRFLEVAFLAEQQNAASLASFLAFWESVQGEEKVPLPESMDAISIMTMHKAKGLAFDIVITPFLYDSRQADEEIIDINLAGLDILCKRCPEVPTAYYPAQITRTVETLNLLYVAFTRARQELHAFIHQTRINNSPLVKAFLEILDIFKQNNGSDIATIEILTENDIDEQLKQLVYKSTQEQSSESVQPPSAHKMLDEQAKPIVLNANVHQADKKHHSTNNEKLLGQNSDENWRPMQWLPKLKIHRSTLHRAELTPERKGTLAHLCLEHLVFSHKHASNFEHDVKRAINIAMRLFPLPLAMPEQVQKDMLEGLLWYANQPETPRWLANGQREQGLLDKSGNLRRIDLLVDLEQEGLLAVDYKTGAKHKSHQEQVQNYMDILAEVTARPVLGKLIYLDLKEIETVSP